MGATKVRPDEVSRLAFAKYLLSLAHQQMEQPEPLACASLLTFHDAAEFLLHMATEHLNVKNKDDRFMSYWDVLDALHQPSGFPERESMRSLNAARVALKHRGTFPSRLQLEVFAETVSRFFQQSVPLVFGVTFDSISLTDFIASEEAKERLQEAQTAMKSGNLKEGFESCALAFDHLLRDYAKAKKSRAHQSPFFFGESVWDITPVRVHTAHGQSDIRGMDDFVKGVRASIQKLQNAVTILSFGLDYRKYAYFEFLTPNVTHNGQNTRWLSHKPPPVSEANADLQFCIDFVVECAFRLQAFDYETADQSEWEVARFLK